MDAEIYITATSPFGARLRLVSAFTGLTLEEIMPPGGAGSEQMKAISFFGKMPAIAIDGRVMIESIALMEYLVEKSGGSTLIPKTPEDRAVMRGIMLAHDNHVLGAVWPMFLQLRTGKPDPAISIAAMQAAVAQYAVLARMFDEAGDFALGDQLTLADLAMVPFAVLFGVIYPVFKQPPPFTELPRLQRWWSGVAEIPEIARVTDALKAALSRAFGPK